MKKIFIVANWKSNKTQTEAAEWLEKSVKIKEILTSLKHKQIIICPPFTLLPFCKAVIEKDLLPFTLGAQDISPYLEGAYTGEVNGKQIKEFGDFVIIGHSERRVCFSESDELLAQKVVMSQKFNLVPIFCVQDQDTLFPKGSQVIAYEPPSAIGTGNPDNPEKANDIAKVLKEQSVPYVLYGGSVTAENVSHFTSLPNIDGVLVGGASLDAQEFFKIIQNA